MDTRKDDLTHLQDRATYVALFDRFFVPLVRYARGFTRDGESAKDIVHDVFLKLWEDRDVIRVKESMKALLYTMVRNRSLNEVRSMKRIDRQQWAVEAAGTLENRHPMADEETKRRILEWINDLPERRREAFMLSRFHDLSHADIARIMNISERTVDTHILLALRSLRERFEQSEREDMTR